MELKYPGPTDKVVKYLGTECRLGFSSYYVELSQKHEPQTMIGQARSILSPTE